jgi:erythromycin esterase
VNIRDRAMARQVRWILGRNPQAKVVLWAHNGHVQRGEQCMGRFLEDMFPGQMVVFGFATGSGTYRAVSARGKGLGDHELAPPPPGSFESLFQAASLPRFVVDVRESVPDTDGAGWIREARPFRSIGALEVEEQFFPMKLAESFDAVIWIEKTSAARPLPGGAR